jgi:hypothetical protein
MASNGGFLMSNAELKLEKIKGLLIELESDIAEIRKILRGEKT